MKNNDLARGLLFLTLFVTFGASAAPLQFSNIFAFGDSLSDSGNVAALPGVPTTRPPFQQIIPSAPYEGGRFSNGPVWVERFAQSHRLDAGPSRSGGTNYAFGGARTGPLPQVPAGNTPSVIEQVGTFLSSGTGTPSDSLYVIFGGGNDLREALPVAVSQGAGAATAVLGTSILNIGLSVMSLANAGAHNFLIANAPDIGLTPALQLAGPEAVAGGAALSALFNAGLDGALDALERNLAIDIARLDIFGLLQDAVADPDAFGFNNVTDTCIQLGGGACDNPEDFLFWDGIHPTSAGHQLIADAALTAVPAPVPLPPALGLFVLALATLGVIRRRQAA